MATLTTDDIAHLAHLARLRLTDEEKERFAGQLTTVVGYVDQLSAVPVKDVPQRGVTGLSNVMAADVLRDPSDPIDMDSQALVDGAPRHDGKFIQVRAVLTDEAGGA